MAQAHAVNAFGAAHIGRAETGNGNGLVSRQAARHAGDPQHLVAGLLHHAVGELVQLREFGQGGGSVQMGTGHQFDLRLAEVGGDVRVREGRAQRRRVRRQGQTATGLGAQAFFFDTPTHTQQPGGCQVSQKTA